MRKCKGFTLVEVLIAVAILAIAIAGMLHTLQIITSSTRKIENRLMQNFIGKQGLAMIKLGLINIAEAENLTQKTILFGKSWYWRVKLNFLKPEKVYQITILTSNKMHTNFQPIITGYHAQLSP